MYTRIAGDRSRCDVGSLADTMGIMGGDRMINTTHEDDAVSFPLAARSRFLSSDLGSFHFPSRLHTTTHVQHSMHFLFLHPDKKHELLQP